MGSRRKVSGLLFFKTLSKREESSLILLLCLVPHGTSSAALAGGEGLCLAPRKWQGVRCSSAVTKQLPSLSLSFEMSLGQCSGITVAPHGLVLTQEGVSGETSHPKQGCWGEPSVLREPLLPKDKA